MEWAEQVDAGLGVLDRFSCLGVRDLGRIKILAGVGKIVFSLHGITPCNAGFISGAG